MMAYGHISGSLEPIRVTFIFLPLIIIIRFLCRG